MGAGSDGAWPWLERAGARRPTGEGPELVGLTEGVYLSPAAGAGSDIARA